MSEKKVLAACIASRKAYDAIASHVRENTFAEQAKLIFDIVGEYYSRDGSAERADYELIRSAVGRSLSSAKHRESFETLLEEIASLDVSPENVAHDFTEVLREAAAAKLASALLMNKKQDEIENLISEYEECGTELEEDEDQVLRGTPLAEITKHYAATDLIQVWPKSLNDRLDGGLLRGHHVVVFARPEMGKTAFLVNSVAGFLSQGLTVLYVGNEDPVQDIVLRIICRLTKRNKFDVLSDPAGSEEIARKNGYDNLILAALTPGSPREIEKLVQEYRPDVLLIDQLRNLAIPVKDGNRVVQLEQAATAARNIGKRFGVLVLSVTQAGDSASGKAVLDMGDVDSSNTGIPAQADVMVGIGATQEDAEMGRRVLSLPKNKRSGRHESFPVRFDPAMSRMWSE